MSSPSGSNETQLSELKAQVRARLQQELSGDKADTSSREYNQFREDNLAKQSSLYEKTAVWAGNIIQIKSSNKKKVQKDIDTAHIACTPGDVAALSFIAPAIVFMVLLIFTVVVPFIVTESISIYYFLFSIILSAMLYVPLANMPAYLAQKHRQEASNQMVLSIFYLVTFMRHTPNLERAMQFAAEHIGPPLSLDLKKVIWNVETQKFQNITESLEDYLLAWRDDAREFVEAIHLIQSSLYETSNDRRLSSLDKALDVMLDETYEKMLHYAQDLKGPMTMLHMLGIILPILGLVILPLAVSFFDTHWTYIASGYNVLLPLGVFYLGKRILATRPTGYGSSENVAKQQLASRSTATSTALAIGITFVFIGMSPLIIHAISPGFDLTIGSFDLLGYVSIDGQQVGPFGIGAGLLSLFFTLGLGLGLGIFFMQRVKEAIKIRKKTKQLELEFASALFQLGNRIGDGIPVELAFGRVAEVMEGTRTGEFFIRVATNIQKLGMGVEEALFDEQHGVLKDYPSNIIESSMKVLLESSRKGPVEASKALMSMSNYIKEMHRVDERLKDLLSDVLSSMKSQINFLLPVIAGIVIGITSMITSVLGAVQEQAVAFQGGGVPAGLDSFGYGIPTFYFQIIVGVYVVQVVYILTYMISGIENGVDPLSEDYLRGKGLISASILYCSIAFVIILLFNLIAGGILQATGA